MSVALHLLGALLVGVFVFLSAFFSGVEMGFFSASTVRIKSLAQMGLKHAKIALTLFRFLPHVLVAILVGNCLANTTAAVLASAFFGSKWVCAFILTLTILVFGEILPKELFRRHPTHLLLFFSKIVALCYKVFLPIVKGLSKLFFIEKIFTKNPLSIKRAQIHSLIVEAKRAGALEEEERRLMQRVLRLSRKKVKEVMTPRVDVVMVQKDAEFEQILEVLSKNKYSRFPVYGEDADDIVGVLYIKDVLKAVQEKRKFKVMDLARAPYFVPQTKQIGKLLSEFQQKKIHIAIVVDEYGGMSGLVTIEDLLEEIVGEMEDLYEREAPKIKALSNKRFLVDARVPLERLHDELGLHFYTRDYETLGGYVMAKFDRIPKEGESFETREAKIFVKKADKRTLWQLEIVKKR